MISSIFNSDQSKPRSMWIKLVMSIAMAIATIITIETWVRFADVRNEKNLPKNTTELLSYLAHAHISGREIGNQMLVHNIALFSHYPSPNDVTTAYVGTSRTKVLRPEWFGIEHAVNGSGNTYNEISYGLLLQAEILRLRFPNLHKVYFESSLLLRRPPRLVLEDDHRKYLPLLETLLPLRDRLPGASDFRLEVNNAELQMAQHQGSISRDLHLHILKENNNLRLYKLITNSTDNTQAGIPVMEDKWLTGLSQNGERKNPPGKRTAPSDQKPKITNDHVKVQRLRNIPSWAPWDGLFDLIALWGREHKIEIILFEPPVRSDLYQFQLLNGLEMHNADLQRVSKEFGIPFVNLNQPELQYMNDWTLFADEDHMETCWGVILLQSAIEEGYQRFIKTGDLTPQVNRGDIEQLVKNKLNSCPQ